MSDDLPKSSAPETSEPQKVADPAPHPFEGLIPPLRAAVEARGFTRLTAVQESVLAAASRGANLRISSQTGSGKTLALGIAIAEDLIEAAAASPKSRKGPRALLIAPTRELAQQLAGELEWLYERIKGLHVAVMTGGTDIGRERRVLARNPVVIVGTPGRLLDHISARALSLSDLRHVVLDEADQMLDMGFKDELDAIIEQLPEERNSHLVSATFPREVRRFADKFAPDALSIEGSKLGEANADITHQVFLIRERERYAALVNNLLMAHGGRCLVFVKRRIDASDVAEKLSGDGFGALPFSGDLSQGQRNRTLSAFKRGVVQILVATDVAARGIDVPDIALVVHGDIPNDTDTYTHRSGRTGRAGQSGHSIVLATPRSERHVRRLLKQAKIDADFAPVPTAKKIRKSVTKRARKKVHALMVEPKSEESTRTYAAELLERYDPATLVAELLQLAEGKLPCEPNDLSARAPNKSDDRDRGRDHGDRDRGPRQPRPPRQPGDFIAFEINWGHKKGATPARLLAHLCRRGDISSRSIGAMEVDNMLSRFEVAKADADSFFTNASVEDERDPHLKIVKYDGEVRPQSRKPSPRRFGNSGGGGGGGRSYGKDRGANRPSNRGDQDRRGGEKRWRDDGNDKPRRRGPTYRKK